MVQRVSTVAFEGIEARSVDVQVQVAPGLPAFPIAECECQMLRRGWACPQHHPQRDRNEHERGPAAPESLLLHTLLNPTTGARRQPPTPDGKGREVGCGARAD